jgi:hypothetical protein
MKMGVWLPINQKIVQYHRILADFLEPYSVESHFFGENQLTNLQGGLIFSKSCRVEG